ncbi:MAG TPA: VPLPA-CTERM sorting domain-containing protein [Gammaproteobacteria bacterium]
MYSLQRKHIAALSLCATLALPGLSFGALIDRGAGLIYDTDLNVTWLADANYASTSGYDADGLMNWSQSVAWAAQLSYGGFDDWRLPTTLDTGMAGCTPSIAGDECHWYGLPATSEMSHLFYVGLNNLGGYDINGNPQAGGGLTQTGPFTNLHNYGYWSGTYHSPGINMAYGFDFPYGTNFANFVGNTFYAMALRDGDVLTGSAVPVPAAAWLLGSGLLGLIGVARRRTA